MSNRGQKKSALRAGQNGAPLGGQSRNAQRGQQLVADDAPLGGRWGMLLAAAVIALAAWAVYANSFSGAFVFDDHEWIERNLNIDHLWPPSMLTTPWRGDVLGGRPLVSLTLALNYAFGGTSVWGYHLVNLLIHVLAAWTLFGIVRRTLKLPACGQSDRVALPIALATALIWTVHPLQTESVTYIIQRTESLVALFYLLTLYCVIRGATAASRGWWYVAAAVSCLFGMATKEVMATAPLVVLLYDRTFLGGSFRQAIAERWKLYVALAATWAVIPWIFLSTHFHAGSAGFMVESFTWQSYLLTQPGVILHYLRLVFWPTGQCLAYGWPAADTPSEIILPGLAIVGLLAWTVWALVKRPPLGFLGACFFLILAPTSSFVPLTDAAFEHRMYLPLAAVVTLVVLGAWQLCAARPSPARWGMAAIALAAALIGLGWVTVLRNRDYRSEVAIWQDAVDKYPMSVRAKTYLDFSLADKRAKANAAISRRQSAVEASPEDAKAHLQLAELLTQKGRPVEAIPEFRAALKLDDNLGEAHLDLGVALHRCGENREAIAEWRRADQLVPGQALILSFIAWQLATDPDDSIRDGKEAVALAERAVVLARQGGTIDKDPVLFATLAGAYAEVGRFDDAVKAAERAMKIAAAKNDEHVMIPLRKQMDLYKRGLPYRQRS